MPEAKSDSDEVATGGVPDDAAPETVTARTVTARTVTAQTATTRTVTAQTATAPPAPPDDAAPETAAGKGKPRRRQARGERRISQLLDAAARVFCTTGYTAASTNSIAREAGVSPGTLYQFFPNKEAIAVELGDQLLRRWRETYGQAFLPAHLDLPLDRLLDAVLDPLIRFNCENPAFAVLMHGPEVPGQVAQEHEALHSSMLTRVEGILGSYLPAASEADLTRIASTAFAVYKAGLTLILAREGAEQAAYIAELKAVLFRYLAPFAGDAVCDAGTAATGSPPH
ncbi:TetR/AcrR family transcriptional regulator [Streptomyces sp. AK02-01A]|uniref:TetR/AcrR family transcriptional regulator n=1 Tax=Streptomyces sp. AK02-01A TaxID=3028648 RepID=UPI0029A56932|nr:TetR/AcrR family transcriptional regulator [Streptomyces sp. AK02-01A]MDX3849241.1 TetR/AcrR family transcriptional regulator [Streptomyces sp. AK02-01A]